MDGVKLDFCPRCRRMIDWALENVSSKQIFIQATRESAAPSAQHVLVPLCDSCGKFVDSTLHVDGFTIYTP